mgnify:CR=1 FL=1
MKQQAIDLSQVCMLVFLFGIGVYAIVQGFRAWQNPDAAEGLGLRWYLSLARRLMPARDKTNALSTSPEMVRAFGLITMIFGIMGAMGMILILLFG